MCLLWREQTLGALTLWKSSNQAEPERRNELDEETCLHLDALVDVGAGNDSGEMTTGTDQRHQLTNRSSECVWAK